MSIVRHEIQLKRTLQMIKQYKSIVLSAIFVPNERNGNMLKQQRTSKKHNCILLCLLVAVRICYYISRNQFGRTWSPCSCRSEVSSMDSMDKTVKFNVKADEQEASSRRDSSHGV